MLQLIESKESIDTEWNAVFCRTESNILFFVQRMASVTETLRWTDLMASSFSVARVAQDLNTLLSKCHYHSQVTLFAQFTDVCYGVRTVSFKFLM